MLRRLVDVCAKHINDMHTVRVNFDLSIYCRHCVRMWVPRGEPHISNEH